MSSAGWVRRKREQFELFSRNHDGDLRSQPEVGKLPQVLSYKPVKDVEIKDDELETIEKKTDDEKLEIENFRSVAIKESAKPSGTGGKYTKKPETVNNNSSSSSNNNNSISVNLNMKVDRDIPAMVGTTRIQSKQDHQQATKKMVYSQYREMLRRYEQSSRL